MRDGSTSTGKSFLKKDNYLLFIVPGLCERETDRENRERQREGGSERVREKEQLLYFLLIETYKYLLL